MRLSRHIVPMRRGALHRGLRVTLSDSLRVSLGAMKDEEHQNLTKSLDDVLMIIDAMEQRLQMQAIGGCFADASLCVWFACTDVCPPGG